MGDHNRRMKRWTDLFLTIGALPLVVPIALVVALAVRVGHGSPVLFRHERLGHRGEPFEVLKFRTMTDARDENGTLLPDEQPREVRDAAPDDVPVVEVRLTTPHHDARMADWHRVRRAEVARLCHEGCEVLVEHARPTTAGAELISEIAGLDAETRRWVPGV